MLEKNKGFTLVEVLIGILIMGVLMAGLSSMFDSTLKKKKKLKEQALFDNSFKGFGQRFQHLLKGADVATSFQLLPVRYKDCTGDGPCFFTMDAGGKIGTMAKSMLGGLNGINFFKDSGIKAYDRPLLTKDHPARIKYFRMPKYPTEVKMSKGKRYFVGWKLKSLEKFPFTMVSRSGFPGYFELPSELATSKPTGSYVILKGSGSGLPVKEIENQLMIFYNGFNSKTYFFSKINKTGTCTPSNICPSIVSSRAPTQVDKFKSLFKSGEYYYASIEVPKDVGSFISSTSVRMVGNWWGQNSSEYPFPFKKSTIEDTVSPEGRNDLKKADPFTMEHYLHTVRNPLTNSKVNSQLFAIPVSFVKLYLKKQTDKTKKLVMQTYEDRRKLKTILSDLDMNAEVYFSRQLSTNKVSAFVIDPEKDSKKRPKKK